MSSVDSFRAYLYNREDQFDEDDKVASSCIIQCEP
jgi:hypothetical protein